MALRSLILSSIALSSLFALIACGDSGNSEFENGGGNGTNGASGGASSGFGGENSSGGEQSSGGTDPNNTSGGPACAAQEAAAARKPVKLLFILDQSGSMGDMPNGGQNKLKKWVPVTTALGSFLQKDTTQGMEASMRLFPLGADSTAKCNPTTYAAPNVAMTSLPNAAMFTSKFVANPTFTNTPTLAVVKATVSDAKVVAAANPDSKVAIVLITDGEPTGCTDDTIQSIANEVGTIKTTIPTYVIGVGNVANLNTIAQSGAGRDAFIVSINDPAATEAQFLAAVDEIRGNSIACDVAIPAPPAGQTLDPLKVNVNYTPTGKPAEQLKYDETCAAGGWHYDDKANPKNVILCPQTCTLAKADPSAKLALEFGCVTRSARSGGVQ